MEPPAEPVRRLAPRLQSEVHDLQPGDWVEDGVVHHTPHRPVAPDRARRDVLARYGGPTERNPITAAQFDRLVEAARARVTERALAMAPDERLDAVLRLWDYPADDIHITIADQHAVVAAAPAQQTEAAVVFGTRSDLLWSTMQSPFGRDLITVGYAADVRLRSRQEMATNAHERLLNVLAYPQPRWRQRFRKHPFRVLGFVLGDVSLRHELKAKLGLARPPHSPGRERGLYTIGDMGGAHQRPRIAFLC